MATKHGNLSFEKNQMGNKVKAGRTKKGERYVSVSRKFATGGYEVKTTISKRGGKYQSLYTKVSYS